jgi:hypothetical protein
MRSARKQPDKPPPIPLALAEDFANRPFGIIGEMLTPGPPEPPRPIPQPFRILPPDWEPEECERLAREREAEIDKARAPLEGEQ